MASFRRSEYLLHLIPWLDGLLVLLISYSLAGIVWQLGLFSAEEVNTLLPVEQQVSHSEGVITAANLDAISSLHLFGQNEKESIKAQPSVDAPETRLSLTLRGIVALSEGGLGRALIAEGKNIEKLFRVGDTITGGAILHEVFADNVILKRGGRFETLTLPRTRLQHAKLDVAVQAASKGPRQTKTPSPPPAVTEQLILWRDRIARDPQQASNLMQAQPVMENGNIKGYRLSPGKQRRLFHGAGLRAGDVVTSVNGIALNDLSQIGTLVNQFKSSKSFELELERNGRLTSLSVNLEE